MSRYLILILLNLPLIIFAITSSLVEYKMGRRSLKKFIFSIVFWALILAALILVFPIYEYLFSNSLTDTEPLSLFDVIQITAIVFVFFLANKTRIKIEFLEKRVRDLHQELSIQNSLKDNK